MELRELERLLDRWRQRGLLSPDQVDAIVAFEVEDGALNPPEVGEDAAGEPFDLGGMLSYGGVFVAVVAVLGLYLTVVDDLGAWPRFALSAIVAGGAGALAFLMARTGGRAAADALGLATVVLVAWAVFHGGEALFGGDGDDRSRGIRLVWLTVGLAAGGVGWAMARYVPSALASLGAAVGLVWSLAALGWLVGAGDADGPGQIGGQLAVLGGFVLAALPLLPVSTRPAMFDLSDSSRHSWLIGSLLAANVAAFLLSMAEAGVYEGLLLPYALGLGAGAVFARSRILVVFAAIFLYEYVGFVVFRTFGGAMAAIIILALVGLGTAVGGMAVQRGLADRLVHATRGR